MRPRILAIETSSERCSVALETETALYSLESEQPRGHADLILQMVQDVIADSGLELEQLDALAYSKGPGAFTSIRIGISVVQGLAFGRSLSVASASSLEVMAHKFRAQEGRIIMPSLDARMSEVYFGVYIIQNGRAVSLQTDQVAKPELIQLDTTIDLNQVICVGSGWQSYAKEMAEKFKHLNVVKEAECYPHAKDLLDIAYAQYSENILLPADQILPVYIRDNVTHGS